MRRPGITKEILRAKNNLPSFSYRVRKWTLSQTVGLGSEETHMGNTPKPVLKVGHGGSACIPALRQEQ